MPEPDALYHSEPRFLEKGAGAANFQKTQKRQKLHPDSFTGETQAEAWLSGCALV